MRSRTFHISCALFFLAGIFVLSNTFHVFAASPKQTVSRASEAGAIVHSAKAASSQIQTNLPIPSWWNGVCDTNNYSAKIGVPATPLGASYRGVQACGPRPLGNTTLDNAVNFTDAQGNVVGEGEYEWECVELSMRYMYLAYGIIPYNAPGGKDVVNNYTTYNTNPILQPVSNPTTGMEPQAGDILSYAGTKSNPSGHTSVVMSTKYTSPGNGTITVLEQNFSGSGTQKLTMTNGTIGGDVTGWLHHTLDITPQTAYPGSKVTISGTDFGANEQIAIDLGGVSIPTTAITDGNGIFSTSITVPLSTQPGVTNVQVVGQTSKFSPQTVFYVQSSWPTYGFNAQHTNFNPDENILAPGNVSNLTLAWNTNSAPNAGSPVTSNGVIYVGLNCSFDAINAATGATLWSNPAINQCGTPAAVVNGVVYTGVNNNFYAINALTGNVLWSESHPRWRQYNTDGFQ